jgi:hypothetical protein
LRATPRVREGRGVTWPSCQYNDDLNRVVLVLCGVSSAFWEKQDHGVPGW